MAYLFIAMILLAIGFAVLSAFLKNVIAFDCAIVGLCIVLICAYYWKLHPVFLILIFVGFAGGIYLLSKTAVGFWLVTITSTVAWAIAAWFAAESATDGDIIWMVFASAAFGILILALHLIHNKRFKTAPSYNKNDPQNT